MVAIAQQEQKKKKAKAPREIYQLRITLGETQDLIWRQLQVTDETTLAELHWLIQASFGWTNSHLHQFQMAGETYSDPRFGLEEADFPVRDERRRTLRQVVKEFGYEYDFGAGWQHHIEITEILPEDENRAYPRCLDGERAGPPENCGGLGGYANLLYVLAHPEDPEYREMQEWVGEGYDLMYVDLAGINWQLRKLAEHG